MRRHGRFALAVLDQAILSVFNFGAALWLLRMLEPGEFGRFTLVMAASHAAVAVQEALTSTPLGVRYPGVPASHRRHLLAVLGGATQVYALAMMIATAGFAFALARTPGFAAATGLFVAGFVYRSYIRSVFYAMRRERTAVALDLPFLLLSAAGLALAQTTGETGLDAILLYLSAANLIPLALAAVLLDRRPFAIASLAAARRYRHFWAEVRWSLAGVAAVLTQRQSHTAIVPALMSPAAYASLAVADTLWGPVRVAIMAAGMVLRPEMTRLVGEDARDHLDTLVRRTQGAMTALVLGTAGLAAVCWPLVERYLFAGRYPDIGLPFVLAGIVTAIQVWRIGPNVALQALHRFRDLGRVTILSAGISFAGTLAATLVLGWPWALLGVLAGELVNLALISRLLARAPTPATLRFTTVETPNETHAHAPRRSR